VKALWQGTLAFKLIAFMTKLKWGRTRILVMTSLGKSIGAPQMRRERHIIRGVQMGKHRAEEKLYHLAVSCRLAPCCGPSVKTFSVLSPVQLEVLRHGFNIYQLLKAFMLWRSRDAK
jgi:hypothetical protein